MNSGQYIEPTGSSPSKILVRASQFEVIDPKLPVWPLSNERPRFVLGALAGSLSVCVWANFPLNRGSLLLAAIAAAKSVGHTKGATMSHI